MTRTLVVSDLHLGGLSGVALLGRPELRAPLLESLAGVDRLVLLGDVLELRHGPPHETLAGARAFFQEVGRALGPERELIVTAGNHDHLMVATWLDARALGTATPGGPGPGPGPGELARGGSATAAVMPGESCPEPLGLEHRFAPAEASPLLARLADWAAPARVTVAYPGLWVRPDVYATHGHFLDAHLTIPTLERIGVGTMGRLLERPSAALASVGDYEAVTSPIYAWRDAITRYRRAGPVLNGLATARAWRALGGARGGAGRSDGGGGAGRPARDGAARDEVSRDGAARVGARREDFAAGYIAGGRRLLRAGRASAGRRAIKTAFPLMVGGLNRAGLGPVDADISRAELRRAGLTAMGEVAARLDLDDAYVIFGHTHRAGPLPGDSPDEWRGRGGARLFNTGCWTYDAVFLTPTPGESPYWPGTAVLVEDSGPPTHLRLLLDRTHGELMPRPA